MLHARLCIALVDKIYQAFCDCAALNPDPETMDDGMKGASSDLLNAPCCRYTDLFAWPHDADGQGDFFFNRDEVDNNLAEDERLEMAMDSLVTNDAAQDFEHNGVDASVDANGADAVDEEDDAPQDMEEDAV